MCLGTKNNELASLGSYNYTSLFAAQGPEYVMYKSDTTGNWTRHIYLSGSNHFGECLPLPVGLKLLSNRSGSGALATKLIPVACSQLQIVNPYKTCHWCTCRLGETTLQIPFWLWIIRTMSCQSELYTSPLFCRKSIFIWQRTPKLKTDSLMHLLIAHLLNGLRA